MFSIVVVLNRNINKQYEHEKYFCIEFIGNENSRTTNISLDNKLLSASVTHEKETHFLF